MLTLRQFPLFAGAAVDELAMMAENLVPTQFPAGTLIASAAAPPAALQLVVRGRIESRPAGLVWGRGHVFGALEVASARELTMSAVAAVDTETLALPASDFSEVLEDNYGVLLSAVRQLAMRMLALPPAARAGLSFRSGGLGLVERLILLRHQLPFSRARLQALAMLAHASDEIAWPAGTSIVTAGDSPAAAYILIDGCLTVRRADGSTRVLSPGEPIGLLETLAAQHHAATVDATTPARALRSRASAILDMLEDHTDVGMAMIATFATALLDTSLVN
jgi:CRP-like cAMP-binding protein